MSKRSKGMLTNPTAARPGSSEKVQLLAARYAAGVPLFVCGDNTDHGSFAAVCLMGDIGEDDFDDDLD